VGGLGGGLGIEVDRNADVARTIAQVVAELRSIAPDRTIEAEIDIDAPVRADLGRLGQLVSNLLGNALTHGDPAQPVTLKATTDMGLFTLSVSNSGAPIEPATMTGLFKPFFRGSVRPSQQGLGLGLHITSEIAKAHEGAIEVTSDKALTTFTFTMPLPEPSGIAA
jgi:sigma-B regulation protein RsbU (phosphoserine phosphatase)